MLKINLEEEDLKKLFEAVNEGYEPPDELIGKLFPSFFEKLKQDSKFNFQELIRHKISILEYAGKRQEGVILASASILGQSAPLQVVRAFGEPGEGGWRNMIVQGDNLQFLKTVFLNQDPLIKDKVKGKVKLIYIDPPFGTKSDFQSKEGGTGYSDKVQSAEFLENLRERFIFMREILADDGSIYVHLDEKMSHYGKILIDEVFGKENFVNEIIWRRRGGALNNFKSYGNITDSLFLFSKSSNFTFHPLKTKDTEEAQQYIKERFIYDDGDGRLYSRDPITNPSSSATPSLIYEYKGYKPPDKGWAFSIETMKKWDACGKLYFPPNKSQRIRRKTFLTEYEGQPIQNLWTDIYVINSQAAESVDYPTQKPEALLERIIEATSNPGDLVMDVFAGSGPTAAVAEKLGRRWIMCDFGKHAIYTMQKRLLNIAESKPLGNGKKSKKYGNSAKPFCVVSVGAYDFTRVMNLRKNKDAYISFVLALFGIPREDKDFVSKYRLDGIYAEKDGDPVEIFPVWDDDYLYHVKVDQEYLKEIIVQSRGRIKGNFFIIVPETCTVISDMTLPNNSGDVVHFKLLKFPYKILEEIARNFDIEEQPDSPSNINNLVSSVGFYFNDEVVIKVRKENAGFRLTTFKTMIVNREGKMYEGWEGLSLILIDLDYDGKVFKLDKAVYAKEMKEGGFITEEGLTDRTAIIAIDKHGNESKPTYITG